MAHLSPPSTNGCRSSFLPARPWTSMKCVTYVTRMCDTRPQAALAVTSALRVRDGLMAASVPAAAAAAGVAPARVLIAIDTYNALHGRTGYGRTDEDTGRRVELSVEELRLVGMGGCLWSWVWRS
eukprot:349604-Chlamydomonas_euryale.AAC.8